MWQPGGPGSSASPPGELGDIAREAAALRLGAGKQEGEARKAGAAQPLAVPPLGIRTDGRAGAGGEGRVKGTRRSILISSIPLAQRRRDLGCPGGSGRGSGRAGAGGSIPARAGRGAAWHGAGGARASSWRGADRSQI